MPDEKQEQAKELTSLDPEEKIAKIKRVSMLIYPLIGAAFGYFKFVEDKSGAKKNAKTIRAFRNGILQWNREFVDVTPGPHLVKLFAHALMHILLKERERARYCDPIKFRYAMENTINRFLEISMPGTTLGPGFFRDQSLDNDAVEQVLDQVPKNLTKKEVEEMCPVCLPIDYEPETEEDEGGQGGGKGMDIPTAALAQMEQMAKESGVGSDLLRILIGDIYEEKIPWEEHLRQFCRETFGQEGRTFRRLSRRSYALGISLPGKDRGLTTPCIAIDLSGSIVGDKYLIEQFLGEICAILRICKKEARFLLHEDRITDDFTTNDPVEVITRLKGGGGTSFVELYQLLEADPPQCLVHCTDLYGEFPAVEPRYPVLFVCGKDHASEEVAGFGTILEAIPDRSERNED